VTHVVDPAGPLRSIALAAAVALPGDVVLIKPGTYAESISLPRSGTAERPITFASILPGSVVVSGAGRPVVFDGRGATHIVVRGLTFDGCDNALGASNAAVRVYGNWTLRDVVVRNADATGIVVFGTGAALRWVSASRNGQAGLSGNWCTDVLVSDCVVTDNNTGVADPAWKGHAQARQVNGLWHVNPDWEAGAGKWLGSDGVTIERMTSTGNRGPGVWFDYENTNAVVRDSRIAGNRGLDRSWQGEGVRLELNPGPVLIEGNMLTDNEGGGVVIQPNRRVTVRGNTIGGGTAAVILRDTFRGAEYTMRDVSVVGNRFVGRFGGGGVIQTWDGSWSATSGADKRIVIDGNTYDAGAGHLMHWAGRYYDSLESVRAELGFEHGGTQATAAALAEADGGGGGA
jgi:hypothetical protein